MENSITAFASYRLPGEQNFTSVATRSEIQQVDEIDFTANNRFYITSFDKKDIYYFLPEEIKESEFFTCDFNYKNAPDEIKKSEYIKQVENIKSRIEIDEFQKVVLSRVKHVEKPDGFDLYELFSNLCLEYPNAFVYLFYSNQNGLWLGATPELLLEKEEDTYKTVALAGTKLVDESWENKEEEEQQFVTDFIVSSIKDKSHELVVSEREDSVIGHIKHLKTQIEFKTNSTEGINSILDEIQPTPAVCGVPKGKTMNYITQIENHDRDFYAGAIGPVGIGESRKLFVNLRCMQVCKNDIALYVGGGITMDSNPDKEWQETERKSKILGSMMLEQV